MIDIEGTLATALDRVLGDNEIADLGDSQHKGYVVRALVREITETLHIRSWQPGDGDTRCQNCGHTYQPWFTDNRLWNAVMGGPEATDDPGGYLCPSCFADRATTRNPRLIWRFYPERSNAANACGVCAAPSTMSDGIVGMDLCDDSRCLDAAWDIAFPEDSE